MEDDLGGTLARMTLGSHGRIVWGTLRGGGGCMEDDRGNTQLRGEKKDGLRKHC